MRAAQRLLLVGTAAVMAAVAGCGGTTASTSPATTASAATSTSPTVKIVNFTFVPDILTVKSGTTVTWTNTDPTNHWIKSDTGVFSSGAMAQMKTFSFTFTKDGKYPYRCFIHNYMVGSIVVSG